MTSKDISNVQVLLHQHDSDEFSMAWEHDGARFHVWLDRGTLALRGKHGTSGTPILYKNPPRGTSQQSPEHFKTRRLDAHKHEMIIDAVFGDAKRRDLFQIAVKEADERERKRLAAAAAEATQRRIKEAGSLLFEAAKEALAYLDAPPSSPRRAPVNRANLRDMLAVAIEAAENG